MSHDYVREIRCRFVMVIRLMKWNLYMYRKVNGLTLLLHREQVQGAIMYVQFGVCMRVWMLCFSEFFQNSELDVLTTGLTKSCTNIQAANTRR